MLGASSLVILFMKRTKATVAKCSMHCDGKSKSLIEKTRYSRYNSNKRWTGLLSRYLSRGISTFKSSPI